MTPSPLVSIILPTYNRCTLLKRAIQSIFKQDYGNFELLIIDDGSLDDTRLYVRSIKDSRIKYLRCEENRGASFARNMGLDAANGDYIAFLDDDDEWTLGKLSKQVEFLDKSPENVGLVYGWMNYFEDEVLIHEHHPVLRGWVFDKIIVHQKLGGCPTWLMRNGVAREIGGFDTCLPRGNDGDFVRRVALNYKVDFIPQVLVHVHVSKERQRISNNNSIGIRNHIHSQETKLQKFGLKLKRMPIQRSQIYSDIASQYAQMGDWGKSSQYYKKAFSSWPFSIEVLRGMYLLLKNKFRRL